MSQTEFDISMESARVPDDFCPDSVQELIDGILKYTRLKLPGGENLKLVTFGSVEPSFNDRDKPWVRTSIGGAPLGTYTYFNGRWVKQYPYEPGQIVSFTGARVELDKLIPFEFCDGTGSAPNLVPKMEPATDSADQYDIAYYMYTGYDT